jgi:uncharacterized protein (AIM24 family)
MSDHAPTPFDQGLFLVHLNRGREQFEKNNLPRAESELEEARRMRPNDEKVLNLLGLVYFKQEKYQQANEIYQALIQLNPSSLTLYFNRGLISFKLGNMEDAEAAFLKALEIKPDNAKIHFYLGNIYERKHQYYNAIFQYRKAGANIMVKRVQNKIASEPPEEVQTATAPRARDDEPPPVSKPAENGGDQAEQSAAELKVTVDHLDRDRMLATLLPESSEAPESPPGEPEPSAGALTVVHQKQAVEPETPLSEIAASKQITVPQPGLFSPPPSVGPSLVTTTTMDETVPPEASGGTGQPTATPEAPRKSAIWDRRSEAAREDAGVARVFAQLRRRDDTFRYLENNLMEVNFSGKVYIKQGTIYSYSGNLAFWVKPQREDEAVPPLVIVSGTGKLLLTDQQREISVIQVDGEEVIVEPSHLLACQETLTPRFTVIEREGAGTPRLHFLAIEGRGMLALSVNTKPLLLNVSPNYPVNVSSANIISWSGDLVPTIVDDEALAELMLPQTRKATNLRLEGTGKVMMERTSLHSLHAES